MSYPGQLLVGSYPSAEMQLVYFTDPADRATRCISVIWNANSLIQGFAQSVGAVEYMTASLQRGKSPHPQRALKNF